MKLRIHYAFILLLIAVLLLMQGCSKWETWSIDFTSESIEDIWELQFWNTYPHIYYQDQNGLVLESMIAHAPYGFDGDFTATLTFYLNASSSDPVSLLDISFGDGSDAGEMDAAISFIAWDIESAAMAPSYYVSEISPLRLLVKGTSVPGLNTHGTNIMKFIRLGSNWKVKVNGHLICDEELIYYSAGMFFPSLNVTTWSDAQVIFKSLSIIYSGSKYPRP